MHKFPFSQLIQKKFKYSKHWILLDIVLRITILVLTLIITSAKFSDKGLKIPLDSLFIAGQISNVWQCVSLYITLNILPKRFVAFRKAHLFSALFGFGVVICLVFLNSRWKMLSMFTPIFGPLLLPSFPFFLISGPLWFIDLGLRVWEFFTYGSFMSKYCSSIEAQKAATIGKDTSNQPDSLIKRFNAETGFLMPKKIDRKSTNAVIILIVCTLIIPFLFSKLISPWLLGETYKLKHKSYFACQNGGRINTYYYAWVSGPLDEDGGDIYIYEKNNQKIFLGGINPDPDAKRDGFQTFVKKNRWLKKDVENSYTDYFPSLEFGQKDYDFRIIDKQKYLESKERMQEKNLEIISQLQSKGKNYSQKDWDPNYSNSFSYKMNSPYGSYQDEYLATFINPDKVNEQTFEEIVNCVQNHDNQLRLPQILIYGKKLEPYKLFCSDPRHFVQIENGKVSFEKAGKFREYFYIGVLDDKGNLIRDVELDQRYTPDELEVKDEENFSLIYQKSDMVKLLFNQDQEPINDYLQTCKNDQGKTVFDIFKD